MANLMHDASEESGITGLLNQGNGKGLLLFDYDLDGDLDVYIATTPHTSGILLKNHQKKGRHWLKVKVEGTISNRQGIGAIVTVESHALKKNLTEHVGVKTHFLGQSDTVVHFGLGKALHQVSVKVYFPASGKTVEHCRVWLNQMLVVREDDESTCPLSPVAIFFIVLAGVIVVIAAVLIALFVIKRKRAQPAQI
eukprot:TRINITY_DN34150_c1_g2_i1.p1 TRINITY_DN34150_c1_g2~~TRINITY_DN34150_c1_g2_i1.p1  ORF type:complete len:210 (-),score=10.18 TRINITY_DN34150_c1_g2_i1:47-631(-)